MTLLAFLAISLVLMPGASAKPKYKVLYTFKGGKDGHLPIGGLVFDKAGHLYGTTAEGGRGCSPTGCGTVFKLTPHSGGSWTKSVLHYFSGSDGAGPQASLAFDKSYNIYGTTRGGGISGACSGDGCGVVFMLTRTIGGKWKETVLHRFAGGSDGSYPFASVVFDASGDVYSSTEHGGGSYDDGTVYELSPTARGRWKEQILHSFTGADGASPDSLLFDAGGNLYGIASYYGAYGVGVAFEVASMSAGKWKDITLYSFPGAPNGAYPIGGLVFGGRNLYGTTDGGGEGFGTIFELKPSGGKGRWSESIIYRFTGGDDGMDPLGPLVFDSAGTFYGSTSGDLHYHDGTLFELVRKSDGTWGMHVLYTFSDHTNGQFPSQLISDKEGNLYGMTAEGGNLQCTGGGGQGCGVVFELTP